MINLNKELITQKQLFKYVEPYDIFNYYFPNLQLNTTVNSPFRKDDNPSFSVFEAEKHNTLLFKDFATGEIGNAVIFVQKLFPGFNYFEALSQIAVDFGVSDKFICSSVLKSNNITPIKKYYTKKPFKYQYANLRIKFRTWQPYDLIYWKEYGISLLTLRKFNILPIAYYYLYDKKHIAKPHAYAFIEKKDKRMSFKIYQPFADKKNKWRTNHSYSAHQGYLQLPKEDNLLIITKSLKDVMSLYEVAKISSIGIQCETYIMKESVINEYRKRFNNYVIVLFDNDEAGVKAASIYKKLFNVPTIVIPKNYWNIKDFSDLVKGRGSTEATRVIYKLIEQIYPSWIPF